MISMTDISECYVISAPMTVFCFISKITLGIKKKIEISFAALYVAFPCLWLNEEMLHG